MLLIQTSLLALFLGFGSGNNFAVSKVSPTFGPNKCMATCKKPTSNDMDFFPIDRRAYNIHATADHSQAVVLCKIRSKTECRVCELYCNSIAR